MAEDKKISMKITGGVLLFILIVSSVMVVLYPSIDENIKEINIKSFANESNTSDYLINSNYALYYQLLAYDKNEKIMPTDIYIGNQHQFYEEYNEKLFNEHITSNYKNLLDKSDVVDYYGYNIESKRYLTNISDQQIIRIKKGEEKELTQYYDYWVVMTYDSKGGVNVAAINRRVGEVGAQSLVQRDTIMRYKFTQMGQSINPIENMIYFYGIKDINDFEHYILQNNFSMYKDIVRQYIIAVTLVCVVVFCLIPYKFIVNIQGLNKVLSIPFEWLIGGIGLDVMIVYNSMDDKIRNYLQGKCTTLFGIYLPDSLDTTTTIILANIAEWAVYLFGVFIAVSLGKSIYKYGVITYIRKYSIMYQIVEAINRNIEKIITRLSHMNLKQENIQSILRFITINGFILTTFCLMGKIGVVGIIIYSMSIYFFVGRILGNIKHYYERLLESTSNLAQGDLNIQAVEENLGMFDPIKKHIEIIKEDFKKSVGEEIRIQQFKTDLITNVSHDLKTPLTSIISYVDLLKQENLSEQQRQNYIDILDLKSSRLQTLIEDLFEMSKASSGHIELHTEQVELVALIKQTLFELEDKIEASGITFRKQFPEQKVYLKLDGMRTFRVFDNLINNITKYGMQDSRAYIDIIDTEKNIVIILKNTAREELTFDTDYITERFTRGDQSRNTEGSGLGLAIARSFVELQEGSFEVKVDGDLFKVIITFPKVVSEGEVSE